MGAGADLFARQIYPLVMDGRLQFLTSIDFLRVIAERSDKYAGQGKPEYIDGVFGEPFLIHKKCQPREYGHWISIELPPEEAIDPVCEMTVDVARARFVTEHEGRTYYFCAAGCQRAFEANPDAFLGSDV